MFRKVETPENPKEIIDKSTENRLHAYNLYFQTLNLFEVCARFRRQKIINSDIFASWIAWFYDTLDDWYFRDQWPDLRKTIPATFGIFSIEASRFSMKSDPETTRRLM